MNANWTVEGWKAQETGASRSDNPHARSSMAFRHWQEGFDQAAAQSFAPAPRREPLGLREG